ncbi:MAG: prephenate dehydrogenase [Flavobacteriaceae bacterium]|nr:MAG: prephenate dehydrogenase [Flavobacteriaceae bacterium]
MKVYIIGIGLIGGSFALAIQKHYKNATIYGIDNNSKHLDEASHLGIIHQKSSVEDITKADVIIVAVPVDASIRIISNILDTCSDTTLVFDVGSTKAKITKVVENHPKRRNFLATHPIAGTEYSGPKAAMEGLYIHKTNIICEIEKTAYKLQEKALAIFQKLGMSIRYMDAISHDKHIAYVSHLSHISSFMLGKTVIEKEKNERDIFDLAGSGFASTARLAKSSPAMWTPIFEQNKENIIEILEAYINNLKSFKVLMQQDRFDEVFQEMENTNYIKKILKEIK